MAPTPIWPSATAPSGNNWFDHFGGSGLDSTKWTSLISGGTLTVTDSYADFNCSVAGQACGAVTAVKLDKTRRIHLSIAWSPLTGVGPSDLIQLVSGAWSPGISGYSTYNPLQRTQYGFQNGPSTFCHSVTYFDATHTQQYWDGTNNVWTSTNTVTAASPTQDNDYYVSILDIDGPNARFRWHGLGLAFASAGTWTSSQGARQFVLTDWVNFSSLEDTSQGLWLVLGNVVNTNGRANDFRYEWVRYAEAPGNVYYQAYAASKNSVNTGHDLRTYFSCDGYVWVPQDRSTLIVARGSTYDAQEAQEPYFLGDTPGTSSFGGTDYLFYMGESGSPSFLQSINLATATYARPQTNTWTKYASNPILQVSATGTAQDDLQIGTPVVVFDATTGMYNLFYNGQSSVDNLWRTFLATATSPTGPYTKQGKILDVGASGAFDAKWARGQSLIRYGGQWILVYEAKDGSSVDHLGWATAPSLLGPYTKSGSSLRDPASGGNTSLTAALNSAPGRTVSVTSSTGFAQDVRVVLADSTNLDNYSESRVRKVVDASTLELYHGLTGFPATTTYVIGVPNSPTWNVRQVWQFGSEWRFYSVMWEPFSATSESASVGALYEGCAVMTHSALGPVDATPTYQALVDPVIPHDVWLGQESVENMTLATYPYGGDRPPYTRPAHLGPVLAQ